MIQRMSPKLKPDFILVATAVKTPLFLFQIVDVNPEFHAVVEHRGLGSALSGHAGKIVEPSDLFHGTTALCDGADQRCSITLNPNVGLRIPEGNVLEGVAILRFLSSVALRLKRF